MILCCCQKQILILTDHENSFKCVVVILQEQGMKSFLPSELEADRKCARYCQNICINLDSRSYVNSYNNTTDTYI